MRDYHGAEMEEMEHTERETEHSCCALYVRKGYISEAFSQRTLHEVYHSCTKHYINQCIGAYPASQLSTSLYDCWVWLGLISSERHGRL